VSAAVIQGAPPRRIPTGLGLLLLAYVASVLAYALVGLGLDQQVPDDTVTYGVTLAVGFAAGFAAIRIMATRADPGLYPAAALLGGLGLAMLFRLRPEVAAQQAAWLMAGIATMIVTLFLLRDHRQLDAFTYTVGVAGLALLLLPIVPGLSHAENGAKLWIEVGRFTAQPAEFGRVLIVIFLASYLSDKRELLVAGIGRFGLPRVKDVGPLLLAWAMSLAVLFLERDMGASLLLFGIFVVMVWVATGKAGYLALGLVLFVIGAFLGYAAFGHVQERVAYWLHALDPATVHDIGYGQLAQSWFAMATGGMVGTGLGQGSPTLIPYVGSDFIFSAFGEELGMLGTSALLLLYLVVIGRGLRIGLERSEPFGKLLAVGLTTVIALQTFVIVGGVTRLIPLTGVPLPLVSYGGSSRVATFVTLALLLRISSGPWIPGRKAAT
jgi:cell division protein FtsW (lipid II flippase)